MNIKKPILMDLPFPIYTKRLMIRPMMPGDGEKIFEAVEESRDAIAPWLPWVDNVKKWEDSEITARKFYADFIQRNSFNFVIFQEDKFIGGCGFNGVNWSIPSAAVGYWCRLTAQRQGFIREAIAAQIQYGFKVMGLKRISLLCNDENERSINIAENLGFELEARAKGLIENLRGEEDLAVGRRYSRFDSHGLEQWDARW